MQQEKNSQNKFVNTLKEIISSRRNKIKKSIYLVSAECNISKSTWRELELGMRKDLTLTTFCKIAEGLDIAPHELLKELTDKLGKNFSFTDITKKD